MNVKIYGLVNCDVLSDKYNVVEGAAVLGYDATVMWSRKTRIVSNLNSRNVLSYTATKTSELAYTTDKKCAGFLVNIT